MEFRGLGASGLRLSALGFGAMTFGGTGHYARMGASSGVTAERLVNKCLEAGVNFFDTADNYSDGASEEVLGTALGARRDEAVLATKFFNRTGRGVNDLGASRRHVIAACEASLRRLRTDYIDLYQVHLFDGLTPQEETLRALGDLTQAGKIRYAGVSNYAGWHLMKGLATADRLGLSRYISHQVNYSLLNREVESELVPLALEEQVGLIVWSPLQSGLLSGKYRRGAGEPQGARMAGRLPEGEGEERLFDIVELLVELADEHRATPSQVALNWLLAKPAVSCVVLGARNEEQLDDNLGAVGWSLSSEDVGRLDAASERPWTYPYSMYEQFAGARNPYYLRGKPFRPLLKSTWDEDSRN